MRVVACILTLLFLGAALALPAEAVPKRIIILRHGEKANSYALCGVGVDRSLALAHYYLGKGSAKSLFAPGESPAAFFVITLHTLELASPASRTWGAPLIDYSVVPLRGSAENATQALNERTREGAADVLTDPRWNGKTVVMIWEHKHIANKKLEAQSKQSVTLRALLHLDTFGKLVPKTWSGENYDYFWIVDYDGGTTTPTAFHVVKQVFPAPYQDVPANDWKTPEMLPSSSGCKTPASRASAVSRPDVSHGEPSAPGRRDRRTPHPVTARRSPSE